MSGLLDEWNSEINTTEQLRQSSTVQSAGVIGPSDALFGLEQRAEFLCRGRGVPVAFAATNDTLFVATSRGFVLRHDVSGVTNAVAELEVSKSPDTRIRRMFVDPLGLHLLLVLGVGSSSSVEVHHVDAAYKKSKVVGKLKGVGVSSVAWGPKVQAKSVSGVLLGTDGGALYELSIDENKKERVKQLLALKGPDGQAAITGLLQAPMGPEKLLVLALYGTHLNVFVGGPTLEQLFSPYAEGLAPLKFIELPLDQDGSQLQSLCAGSIPDPAVAEGTGVFELPPPQVFAVLSPSGIYYGQLNLDLSLPDETDHLQKHHLLPAAVMQPQQLQPGLPVTIETPLSLAMTQYHFVVLYGTKVQYINRISKQVVQEVALDRFASPVRGATSMPLGLSRDHVAGRVAIMAGDDAYEVDAAEEDRDMWRVFMDKGEFQSALLHCRTSRQRNAVYLAQGESLFEEGEYVAAATLFGKLTSTSPSFEELALRLMETGEGEAVLAFLTTRLDTLGREDRPQATMVATWLTELLLDQVNRALLNQRDPEGAEHYALLVEQLRSFLQRHVDVLDPGTTVGLLSGYGRVEELMQYARCRGDNEALLEYLLQRGEAQNALAVLRKPSVSPELFYKFASSLMALAPGPTVQAWIDAQPPLEPRRLLPALLQFGEAAEPGFQEALKYVRFCLHRLGSTDAAIHNLAVALLSLEEGSEDTLLEYLRTARDPLGQPLYDAVHALRLVRDRGRLRASVQLFCEVGMYEDAVSLALTFNRQLATAIARKAEGGGEGLSRKLWLAIARHIIDQGLKQGPGGEHANERIQEISSLLEEAGGAVRIEDILPLFPDFVEIGAFKEAICSSLEKYNQEIEDLRREMQAATHTAQAIREELTRLEHRTAALDLSEPCVRCGRPLFQPPPTSAGPSGGCIPRLFLFPSGNAFHGSCLCAEVCALAPPQQKARVLKLLEKLAKMPAGGLAAVGGDAEEAPSRALALRRQLDAEVAAEDPFTGEVVARNIDKPFVLPEEASLAESWAL